MTTEATATETEPAPENAPVVAYPGTWYRLTRYVMFIILMVYGGLSIKDGFYSWQPTQWTHDHPKEALKSKWDIGFNQALGAILPPLGIFVLVVALRNSRGTLRLENGIVYIPSHPPVPLDKIQVIDRELWDKKGVAYCDYELDTGQKGTFKLDDYLYERDATDKIFAAIESALLKDSVQGEATTTEAQPEQVIPQPAPAALKAPAAPSRPAAAPVKPAAAKPAAPAAPARPAAAPVAATPPRPKIAPAGPRTPARPPQMPPRPPQA